MADSLYRWKLSDENPTMKKFLMLTLIMVALLLIPAVTVFAAPGVPPGSCPPGYDFRPFLMSDEMACQNMSLHFGDTVELGYICVKHVTPDRLPHFELFP
jgi:hypothetical protein